MLHMRAMMNPATKSIDKLNCVTEINPILTVDTAAYISFV